MSFSAALVIAGNPYTVRHFSWGVQQNTDGVGRPDAQVHGGQLTVELDSKPDDVLQHWALDDTKRMNGKLVIFSDSSKIGGQEVPRTTIEFEDAYCISLSKQFDGSASAQGMTMTLTLSANKLSSGTVKLDNKWPL